MNSEQLKLIQGLVYVIGILALGIYLRFFAVRKDKAAIQNMKEHGLKQIDDPKHKHLTYFERGEVGVFRRIIQGRRRKLVYWGLYKKVPKLNFYAIVTNKLQNPIDIIVDFGRNIAHQFGPNHQIELKDPNLNKQFNVSISNTATPEDEAKIEKFIQENLSLLAENRHMNTRFYKDKIMVLRSPFSWKKEKAQEIEQELNRLDQFTF